jgi:hypothetical protein
MVSTSDEEIEGTSHLESHNPRRESPDDAFHLPGFPETRLKGTLADLPIVLTDTPRRLRRRADVGAARVLASFL